MLGLTRHVVLAQNEQEALSNLSAPPKARQWGTNLICTITQITEAATIAQRIGVLPSNLCNRRNLRDIIFAMEPITQKLIHSFGALADLGEEVADTGDFNEMVRTSLHLLLGTLAIRRGAIVEYRRIGK